MIGEGEDEALLCFTDLYQFCTDCFEAVGEWYYPNGSTVKTSTHGDALYVNKSHGVVRLHRRNNASILTDLYCCEIENSTRLNQTICVHIYDEDLPTSSSTPAVRKKMDHILFTSAEQTDTTGREAKEKEAARNGTTIGGAVAGGLVLLIVAGILLTTLLICR